MAYFAPYVDEAGLHIPTYVDIRDDLLAKFRQIYGEDVYLENDSQDYQMISAFASKTNDTNQILQMIWNNHSSKTAIGTALSSLVKLNGIKRKAASYSTCVLTLTGTAGTEIIGGSVKDDSGYIWDLPATVTLTGETTEITAQCEVLGAVEAVPGTITKINTPQAGWTAVTNEVAAVVGAPVEIDEDLRLRQSQSVALPSRNMLDGTRAAVAAVDGVARSHVYDNDTSITDFNGIPGHSIAAVVEGGLDADIAEALYLHKGPGGGTYGSTTYVYVNSEGIETPIRFSRPIYHSIDVSVNIRRGTGYTSNLLGKIKTSIESYIRSLSIGDDVSITGLLAAVTTTITNPRQPAFLLGEITVGENGDEQGITDIQIPFDGVADVGNIIVSEVS